MNKEEFINVLKIVVINDSIKAAHSNLLEPAGRQPQKKILELSEWFNKLDSNNQNMALRLIKESVEISVFGFLCVLDGVRAIESTETKGQLKLFYEKGNEKVLLNNPDDDYLHNLL